MHIIKLGIMVNIFKKSAFFQKAGNETIYFIIWKYSWYLFTFLDPVSIPFDTEVAMYTELTYQKEHQPHLLLFMVLLYILTNMALSKN